MNEQELAKDLVIARISAYFGSGHPGMGTLPDEAVSGWTRDAIRIAKTIVATLK